MMEDIPLVGILLDIKKAYESIHPAVLVTAMQLNPAIPKRFIFFAFHWVTGHTRKIILPPNDLTEEEEWIPVFCGVPQGSVLAPFLFNNVMNTLEMFLRGKPVFGTQRPAVNEAKLQQIIRLVLLIMFADDTSLYAHGVNQQYMPISTFHAILMIQTLRPTEHCLTNLQWKVSL
jgi:hypothetical protein